MDKVVVLFKRAGHTAWQSALGYIVAANVMDVMEFDFWVGLVVVVMASFASALKTTVVGAPEVQ